MIRRLVNFRIIVKSTNEEASEKVIIYGRHRLPPIPPPIITGRRGRTQGARTVRIPAMNERKYSDIEISLELITKTPMRDLKIDSRGLHFW